MEKILSCPTDAYEKLSRLSSPYLPKIFLVEERKGKTYVLEEYIEGRSLSSIKEIKSQINQWFLEICQGLLAIHEENLIHRDIKHSNLLLGEDGHIRLIDFDAVREDDGEKDSDTHLLGTKGYAPPEQYGFSSTDVRADIYTLGVTLKELLGTEGNHWIYGSIIEKCTHFAPEKRYSSVKSLLFPWLFLH